MARRIAAIRAVLKNDFRAGFGLEERLPGGCLWAGFCVKNDFRAGSGTSGSTEPSHVLRAIGHSPSLAAATLRFLVGRFNTAEEIEYAGRRIVEMARSRSP